MINGLALTYVSTNPGSIAVSATGAVDVVLSVQLGDHCYLPAHHVQSSANQRYGNPGHRGAGAQQLRAGRFSRQEQQLHLDEPARVRLTSCPSISSTGTIGNQIKLPYSPNSMVLDPTGTTLYFGSYRELMTYTAATNSLASESANVPGVVLAVSPDQLPGADQRPVAGRFSISTRRLREAIHPSPASAKKLPSLRTARRSTL